VKKFFGKDYQELENAYGFTQYIELKDRLMIGFDQDHRRVVDAFLCFVHGKKLTVMKTENDVLKDIVDVSSVDIRKQLLALEKDEGLFYDEDLEISYAFVTRKCFAYVLPSMLMVSANEENIQQLVKFLDHFSLQYIGPEERPDLYMKEATNCLQIKIVLDGVEPEIWRRFVVEDYLSFHDLHKVIQRVMGWTDYHAYMFTVGRTLIEGVGGDMGFAVDTMWRSFKFGNKKALPAAKTKVWEMLDKEGMTFSYVYDLGDMWQHSVVVEKIMPFEERDYPVILDGARACPPEDCGGVHGYRELLEIQKDKSHPLYQERIMRWLGRPFDPEYFDPAGRKAAFQEKKQLADERIKMRKLGRNEPCYCGSGKKYKKCCLEQDRKEIGQERKIPIEV